MLPATLQKRDRKQSPADHAVDPYELVRRLSIVQAEAAAEALEELERKRTNWENELLQSRGVRQTQIRNRTQTTPNVEPHRHHRRSASISLAPNQHPLPAYTDLPAPPRRQSLPFVTRHHYPASPRRSSLKRRDSGELETINENAVAEPVMRKAFTEWAEDQRKQPSIRSSVGEDHISGNASTQPLATRQLSFMSKGDNGQQDSLQSETQSTSKLRSSLAADKEHRRHDRSKSNESPRSESRKSSLLNRFEQYWKPGHVDASDSEAFDSKASTLRSSWRSSTGGSISSRRPSILKKLGDDWVLSSPPPEEQLSVTDIHTDEDESGVNNPVKKRRSGLFSKLRH